MANTKSVKKQRDSKETFPLSKENYILMSIGLLIIVLGYVLMAGKENIFSFTKMSLSVIFILFGFGFIIYGIMKPKKLTEKEMDNE